jgi:hypothetical protein
MHFNKNVDEEKGEHFQINCKHCELSFPDLKMAKKHIKELLDNVAFIKCFFCDLDFKNFNSFSVHLSRNHRFNYQANNDNTNKSKICEKENASDVCEITEKSHENSLLNENIDLNKNFGYFLLTLKSKFSVTDEILNYLIEQIDNIISELFKFIPNEYKDVSKNLLSLNNFRSKHLRTVFFKRNYLLTTPIEINLGTNAFNKKLSYYYVPILENLKNLLDEKQFFKNLQFEKYNSNSNNFSDYSDGTNYKNVHFKEPAIELIFYMDAFELTSPIGPCNKHKMMGIYYTLGNLPTNLRFRQDIIQLAIIVDEKHMSKYKNEIFAPLIRDLQYLENIGVENTNYNKITHLKGLVVHMVGDNEGLHEIGGFSKCFSSGFVCRHCLFKYDDLLKYSNRRIDRRSPENPICIIVSSEYFCSQHRK